MLQVKVKYLTERLSLEIETIKATLSLTTAQKILKTERIFP